MRKLIALLIAAVALGALALAAQTAAQDAPLRDNMLRTVTLIVMYDEDVEKTWRSIPWTPGMTVEAAMRHAKSLPGPRALTYESRGSGERAFLTSLDGLANEAGAAGPKQSKNWLFRVNDKPGEASFAVTTLNSGDTILWSFATYDWAKPSP